MNTKVEFHKKTETILAARSGCVWGGKADFVTQLTGQELRWIFLFSVMAKLKKNILGYFVFFFNNLKSAQTKYF